MSALQKEGFIPKGYYSNRIVVEPSPHVRGLVVHLARAVQECDSDFRFEFFHGYAYGGLGAAHTVGSLADTSFFDNRNEHFQLH
jgi:hypothetical protein